MKKPNIDISLKYIVFKLDGRTYLIHFRENFKKGIYDVNVWVEDRDKNSLERTDAKVELTYPPQKVVIKHVLWERLPRWLATKLFRR